MAEIGGTYRERMADGDLSPSVAQAAVIDAMADGLGVTFVFDATRDENIKTGVDLVMSLRIQTKKRNRPARDFCAELGHALPPGRGPIVWRDRFPQGFATRRAAGVDHWDLMVYGATDGVRVFTAESFIGAWECPGTVRAREEVRRMLRSGHVGRYTPLGDGFALFRARTDNPDGTVAFYTYNLGIPWRLIDHRLVMVSPVYGEAA